MKLLPLVLATVALAAELQIEVTQPVECDVKSKKGDNIQVHYLGTLAANGQKFDSSYDRNRPFGVKLGAGMVIKGWDEGLLDMCIGEKRKLTIPPEYGYGQRQVGPIPAGSTLVFETELLGIDGVPTPEKIIYKETGGEDKSEEKEANEEKEEKDGSASSLAGESAAEADKNTEAVAQKVASAVSVAADVAGTMLADTDDSQEHNEL